MATKYLATPAQINRANQARVIDKTHAGGLWTLYAAEFGAKKGQTKAQQRKAIMAHLREVDHYKWFARQLRCDEKGNVVKGGTHRYKEFIRFTKEFNAGEI